MNRSCRQNCFFLCCSKSCDGVFFLAFVLFPDSSHRVAKQSISEPYQNWNELLEDIKNHVFPEHHLNTIKQIHENNEQPRKRYWRYNIEKKNKEKFEDNRIIIRESFFDMYLRENQEKGCLNMMTVIVQLTKYYAIAFSKFLSLLKVSFQYQRLQISDNGWCGKHVGTK